MNENNSALSMLQQYSDSEDDMDDTNKSLTDNIQKSVACTINNVGVISSSDNGSVKEHNKDELTGNNIEKVEETSVRSEILEKHEEEKREISMDTLADVEDIHKDVKEATISADVNPSQQIVTESSSDTEAHCFTQTYREVQESDSDIDTTSSDESEEFNSIIDLTEDCDDEDTKKQPKTDTSKSKMLEDLGIQDLPPLEDLTITVPQEECIPIGKISNIIDLLVIVTANKGTPAIDLDSVLFLDHGQKTLGQVLDVFGPVSEPMYMVRFNSAQHIVDKGIEIGMQVYFAPRTSHTSYVFIDSLLKLRGSDASWENDAEPPDGCLDYSDDEEERKAKAAMKANKLQTQQQSGDNSNTTPSQRRKRNKFKPNARQFQSPGRNPSQNPFYMRGPPPPPVEK